MDTIMINWWAVIVAAVVSMVIGSIWFGPLFGKKWMEVMGMQNVSEEEKKKMMKSTGMLYAVQFILSLLTLYILAHYIAGWQPKPGAWGGIINALWIWLGFIMPTLAGNAMWSGKSKKLAWNMFWINTGYNFILYIVFGAILGGWQ
ncbi:MAG: DUF1761 domain-containing protein [Candidatus Pacebacteria bacterium]|nr:DUF1761 domain-containing protein [Candidatus Paceibacterota bacterium]MBP9851919.1 DUF1761 domain-containing protein [Candidatus Paceibacterota bacterium]